MAEQLEAVRHAEQLLWKKELDREAEELVLKRLDAELLRERHKDLRRLSRDAHLRGGRAGWRRRR